MNTLDQVLDDVTAESTLLDSLGTFVQGLKGQLATALANADLSAENQAKVDQIFEAAEANKARIAAALTANLPPAG